MCERNCSRTPPGCLFRVDRFGIGLKYQCHCFDIADCDFDNDGHCKGARCIFGYSGPTCQRRCPQELFGLDCTHKCRCKNGTTCHQITGHCKEGCEPGRTGSSCQYQTYENIALGRPAFQSSDFEVKFMDGRKLCSSKYLATAGFAVDGKYNQNFQHKSCSRTQESSSKSYWYVILDRNYTINQIRIYAHSFFHYGLNVFVGDKNDPCSQLCYESKSTETILHISCQRPLVGETVYKEEMGCPIPKGEMARRSMFKSLSDLSTSEEELEKAIKKMDKQLGNTYAGATRMEEREIDLAKLPSYQAFIKKVGGEVELSPPPKRREWHERRTITYRVYTNEKKKIEVVSMETIVEASTHSKSWINSFVLDLIYTMNPYSASDSPAENISRAMEYEFLTMTGEFKVGYCGSEKGRRIFSIRSTVLRKVTKDQVRRNIYKIVKTSQTLHKFGIQKHNTELIVEMHCNENTTTTNNHTFFWPMTKVGTTAKIICGANVATRLCSSSTAVLLEMPTSQNMTSPQCSPFTGIWEEPDISQCYNTEWIARQLKDIKCQDIDKQNIDTIAKELLGVSEKSMYFKEEDINLVIAVHEEMMPLISNVSTNVIVNDILLSINNVINTPEEILVVSEQANKSVNRMLNVIGTIPENVLLKEQQLTVLYDNLGVGVAKVEKVFNGLFYGILYETNETEAKNVVIQKSRNERISKINSHIIASNIPNIQITKLDEPVTISFNLIHKDVYQNERNIKNSQLLSIISNTGCGISFVFLILTVIVHVYFNENDDETRIQGSGYASVITFPQAALINENIRHQNEGNAMINADIQVADKNNRRRLRLPRKATAARAARDAEND
ncbi:Hypothetical predicted protein [Octopus vulgaris]|uniref:Uncharacterized protein n=1 Tax=Octopus vulgaris TaxID=6645 RepID=A0AA36BB65_OCTVU|nr:Hypothetical predicted protein [Octopus vulgaris]